MARPLGIKKITRRQRTSARHLRAILGRQGNRCSRCPERLEAGKFHIDHRTPLALGGRDTLSNKQALCIPCHRLKTSGNGHTSAGSDVHAIAKVKRHAKGGRKPRSIMEGSRASRTKRFLDGTTERRT